jgi:hypothetical protein
MVSIRHASCLNFRARAFHVLCMKEGNGIIGIQRGQLLLFTACQIIQFRRVQPRSDQHTAAHRSRSDPAQKITGARIDARPQIRIFRCAIALIGCVQTAIGA